MQKGCKEANRKLVVVVVDGCRHLGANKGDVGPLVSLITLGGLGAWDKGGNLCPLLRM